MRYELGMSNDDDGDCDSQNKGKILDIMAYGRSLMMQDRNAHA